MLETRRYYKAEIEEILNTKDRQTTCRKLSRYNVIYEASGWGTYSIDIKEIKNPFKLYCILDLGMHANSDFERCKEFMYFFFCDEKFPTLSDEEKEKVMNLRGTPFSRQTISNWINRLESKNLICRSESNAVYYFSYAGTITHTDKETYLKAWRKYWYDREFFDSAFAISNMIGIYGGIAKKHLVPAHNAFYVNEINRLIDLVSAQY